MDEEEFFDVDTLLVTEDDGTETEYAVLDKFSFEDKKYTVLAVITGDSIGDEDLLFAYEEEGEDMIISNIEDDAEFERVSAYYDQLNSEEQK